MNKTGLSIVAVCVAVTCYAAGLMPQFPSPKDHPAKMRILYMSRTNGIYTQANGDFEDVHLVHIKLVIFTGIDPNPFGNESTNIIVEKEVVLGSTVTPRLRRNDQPRLTIDQWRDLQPSVPPIPNQ